MKTIIGALIGIGGAIIGAILTYFLSKRLIHQTHRNALQIIQINEFNRAASKFRETVRPVLKALIPPYDPLPDDLGAFLYRYFHDFKNAVIEFSAFEDDPKTKTAFLKAWYEYYCPDDDCNENCKPHFIKYSLREISEEEKPKLKNLARSRIEKILEFAKPK